MPALFVAFVLLALGYFCIATRFFSPCAKGAAGERKASLLLQRHLDPSVYFVLEDIYLPSKYGTTQIDHIVVSKYGVFVVETKYYAGKIYGSERAQYWTQYLPNTESRLYNPIKQNLGHLLAVSAIIKQETPTLPISIIAFKDAATLKVRTQTAVVYLSELPDAIACHTRVVYTDEQVNRIHSLLSNANIIDPEIRKQHSENVRKYVYDKYFK